MMDCHCLPRLLVLLMGICLSWANPAWAHLTPNSEIRLDVGSDAVIADIIVPRGEYAYATGNPIDRSQASLDQAGRYLTTHFAVRSENGSPWTVAFRSIDFVQIAGPPDLHAVAVLRPPPGASTRDFSIDWRVVVGEVPNHFALFVLQSSDGALDSRKILGAVRQGSTALKVEVGEKSSFAAIASAISLGAHHILLGYDHILFLLALLLPAPLIAHAGRWRENRPWRQTIWQLTRIVTAFTIGHSITLIGATLGHWALPAAPVEIAIAISVLVSAVHAIRPLLPGKEPLIAIGFGLIHGLAFATLIQHAGADAGSGAASLIGFNIGIELVQMTIVMMVAPSLLILSRSDHYRALRTGLAGMCVVASLGWTINRATGAAPGFVASMEACMQYGGWLVLALALLAFFKVIKAKILRTSRPQGLVTG